MLNKSIPEISSEERDCISKLRNENEDLKKFKDGYIVRWLRAHHHDVAACASGLKKHVLFRKAWGMEELVENWKRPEVLQKYDGYDVVATDREGAPVLLTLFGNQDVEGLMKSCHSLDYLKYSLFGLEKGLKKCEELAEQTGNPFEQILMVFDLNNMTSSHYSFKPFTSSFLTLISLGQEHYPLLLKKIIVIKAPSMTSYAYKLLTPFLSEENQKLVAIPGEEEWEEMLFECVAPEKWPKYWGGKLTDPDGDPKCPSLISFGLGPIPESFYINSEEALQRGVDATIYAGDKHLVEIQMGSARTQLRWQFKTSSEDIGFAIYFDSDGETEEVTDMEIVFPTIRLESALVPVSGSVLCQKPGRYIVEFDNSYSWFSAKELKYSIEIQEL